MKRKKLLIVEDQFIEANNLQLILHKAGYDVCGIARSVESALVLVEQEHPSLVLLDIFLQGDRIGIHLAHILRKKRIAFIYLSANSNKDILEMAKETHPYGFLVKPFREKDVLVMLEIADYLHKNSLESFLENESESIQKPVVESLSFLHQQGMKEFSYELPGIIGTSRELQTVIKHLKIVAPTDTSVLILGESGTGKELIAEYVHKLSRRQAKPFIKVNCGALPSNLIESILFGHEKGAFTGANERRLGKFELANGGSIFLDEIGELPFDVQSKLLRVLQEKEIERIGGHQTIKVDIRVLTATNRNLEEEVAGGRFRMDLYYRLNVFPLLLPPLRERKEDMLLLCEHFISTYSKKLGQPPPRLGDSAINELMTYEWPGNIRELEHAVERSILLNEGKTLNHIYLFPNATLAPNTYKGIKTIEEIERDHIISVLEKCNGRVFGKGGAAEILGMNVSTLNSRIKKLGIDKSRIKLS